MSQNRSRKGWQWSQTCMLVFFKPAPYWAPRAPHGYSRWLPRTLFMIFTIGDSLISSCPLLHWLLYFSCICWLLLFVDFLFQTGFMGGAPRKLPTISPGTYPKLLPQVSPAIGHGIRIQMFMITAFVWKQLDHRMPPQWLLDFPQARASFLRNTRTHT